MASRLSAKAIPIRTGSRSGAPPFEWADERTWPAMLSGVSAVYIVYAADLVAPGAPALVQAFAQRAADAGVGRLVLLSGRGEEEAERAEQAVLAAGTDATVVRSAFSRRTSARRGSRP